MIRSGLSYSLKSLRIQPGVSAPISRPASSVRYLTFAQYFKSSDAHTPVPAAPPGQVKESTTTVPNQPLVAVHANAEEVSLDANVDDADKSGVRFGRKRGLKKQRMHDVSSLEEVTLGDVIPSSSPLSKKLSSEISKETSTAASDRSGFKQRDRDGHDDDGAATSRKSQFRSEVHFPGDSPRHKPKAFTSDETRAPRYPSGDGERRPFERRSRDGDDNHSPRYGGYSRPAFNRESHDGGQQRQQHAYTDKPRGQSYPASPEDDGQGGEVRQAPERRNYLDDRFKPKWQDRGDKTGDAPRSRPFSPSPRSSSSPPWQRYGRREGFEDGQRTSPSSDRADGGYKRPSFEGGSRERSFPYGGSQRPPSSEYPSGKPARTQSQHYSPAPRYNDSPSRTFEGRDEKKHYQARDAGYVSKEYRPRFNRDPDHASSAPREPRDNFSFAPKKAFQRDSQGNAGSGSWKPRGQQGSSETDTDKK